MEVQTGRIMRCKLDFRLFASAALLFAMLLPSSNTLAGDNLIQTLYQQAQSHYQAENYQDAIEAFSVLIDLAPEQSHYHHLLGRAFGNQAKQSNWLDALNLAKKTRQHFEKAVELDPNNIDALRDLILYYNTAPGLIGGNKSKAKQLNEQLVKLENQQQQLALENKTVSKRNTP